VVETSQEGVLFMVGHVDAEAEKIKFMSKWSHFLNNETDLRFKAVGELLE